MSLQFFRTLALLLLVSTIFAGCSTTPAGAPAPSPPRSPPLAPPPQPAPAPLPGAVTATAAAPASAAAVSEKVMYGPDVFFASSSASLAPADMARIADFAERVRGLNLEVIIAVGHADLTERATDATALTLSKARADAVKSFLVGFGIESNRVYTEGKGRKQPIADNTSISGRAKNRRVELEVVGTRRSTGAARPPLPRGYVPVLFGTNRAKTGSNDPAGYFNSTESEQDPSSRLTLGRVTVKVPPNRRQGEIKEPGFFSVTLERLSSTALVSAIGASPIKAVDSDTDFSFTGPVEEFTGRAFADALKVSMTQSRSKSALVYVHGFANSFKDAAFRTAQFAYDLADEKYDVVPVLFSWPSDPDRVNYVGAADRAWSAGQQLAAFLEQVTATTGAGVVHIVAHSKGAQVLLFALDAIRVSNLMVVGKDGKNLVPRFNQIVLAAPDIRVIDFSSLVLPAVASQHGVTNYVSSNDAALKASKRANAGARAGDSGSTAIIVRGVETIDVTAVNYRPGGHSSFADSARVIADIRELLSGKTPAERRLPRVPRLDLGYWLLED